MSWRFLAFVGRVSAALAIANALLMFVGLSLVSALILLAKGKFRFWSQTLPELATIAIQVGVPTALLSGPLICIWDAVLRRKVIRQYGCSEDYNPMQRRSITVNDPVERVLEIIRRGLAQLSWIRADSVMQESNVISAKVGRSFGFWTATLAVCGAPDNGRTRLLIESRPRSRLGLVDYGEGIHNVEELTRELRRWLHVSDEA